MPLASSYFPLDFGPVFDASDGGSAARRTLPPDLQL